MEKENAIKIFESIHERRTREKRQNIVDDYLSFSDEILSKVYSPNRIMLTLGEKYEMSIMGIKRVLKECGVYIDKDRPCVLPSA